MILSAIFIFTILLEYMNSASSGKLLYAIYFMILKCWILSFIIELGNLMNENVRFDNSSRQKRGISSCKYGYVQDSNYACTGNS